MRSRVKSTLKMQDINLKKGIHAGSINDNMKAPPGVELDFLRGWVFERGWFELKVSKADSDLGLNHEEEKHEVRTEIGNVNTTGLDIYKEAAGSLLAKSVRHA